MTIAKADLAKKIADDCGFMKGEAVRELAEEFREQCNRHILERGNS